MSYELYIILKDTLITIFEFICLFILLGNEEEKYKYGKYILGIILCVAVIINTHLNVPVLFKMLVIEILITILGGFFYKSTRLRLVIYGFIYLLILFGCELVVIQSWNIVNPPVFSTNILKEDFAWTVVILAKSLTLLFMLILNKIIGNIKNIRRMTEGLPIVLSSLPFLIVMVCLYIIMPQAQNNTHRMLFLICDICVFGLFIASIFFTEYYISIQQEKREEEAALYELKVKSDYYLKKTNIENEIRQIYHDLKNHFLLTEESKTKEEILKKLSLYETYCETGNDFLNVILSEKLNQAQKKGIRIECDVDFSQGSFLLPLDISTIFGNLLDNAIEACLRIEDDEPYIFVSCKARGNMISVVIKNSMISNSFGLKTTKKDKHFHGYGLVNVKKALEDYNGEMFIKAEGTEFLISLIIPIPKEIQSEKSNFK